MALAHPNHRFLFWLLALIPVTVLIITVTLLLVHLPILSSLPISSRSHAAVMIWILIGSFAIVVSIAIIWALVDGLCLLPLAIATQQISISLRSQGRYPITWPPVHLLGSLPTQLDAMAAALSKAQEQIALALQNQHRELTEQKAQLESVLRQISEGVIVCDADARIVLYNPAAVRLLPETADIGLGRSLYDVWPRETIENSLEFLLYCQNKVAKPSDRLDALNTLSNTTDHSVDDSPPADIEFVATPHNGSVLLDCRLSLLPTSSQLPSAFVIVFHDSTAQLELLNRQRPWLKNTAQELCQHVANLQAAAENLSLFSNISPEQRRCFQQVIIAEGRALSEGTQHLTRELSEMTTRQWPMADVKSSDLVGNIIHHLQKEGGPQTHLIGIPMWLHVDTQAISGLLHGLLEKLHKMRCQEPFEIEFLPGNHQVYLDIRWIGQPLTAVMIESWLSEPLPHTAAHLTIAEVLRRHNSDLWSQAHRDGIHALLRLPLPPSPRPWRSRVSVSERPEFYDFTLINQTLAADLAQRSLTQLNYVVFDTETTGLEPSKGDEIVQLAGVRVVNGRILRGELFDHLVNPGRSIPKTATRFHGIVDTMVVDQPSLDTLLPQFKQFIGSHDTVLVAHNAAFDMQFINKKAVTMNIELPYPVLDTVLLSYLVDEHTPRHTLDAIAQRLHVTIEKRHTALGDALATAEILLKLIDLLAARGITTLGQALAASARINQPRQ